jgi:hypothetical protein
MGRGIFTIIFISILALFSACKQYPEGVLSPDKMKYVFFDMMLADEFNNYYVIQGKDTTLNFDSIRCQNYMDILRLHNIDSNDFKRSLAFYKKNVEQFSILIDTVYQYAGAERERRFALEAALKDSLENSTDSLSIVDSSGIKK